MGLYRTHDLNRHSMAVFSNHLSFIVAIVALLKYCVHVAKGEYYDWTTPVIMAAVVCEALNTSFSSHNEDHSMKNKTEYVILPTIFYRVKNFLDQRYLFQKINSICKSIQCIVNNDCHFNAIFLSTALIFSPCMIFFVNLVIGHLSSNNHGDHEGHEESFHDEGSHLAFLRHVFRRLASVGRRTADERRFIHRSLANDFGKLGAIALSFLLLPVLKHPSIFQALKLSEIHVIRLHVYAGSLAIFGGLVHGLYYTWIWIKLEKYSYDDVFPMDTCWEDLYYRNYDETCYSKFINLLGVVAGISFVVLGTASLWWVRRQFYRVFYFIHITLSNLILFCLIMHYNKMIYYLAPSLLHYMASNVPIFLESLYKSWWQGGVQISRVVFIPDSGGCVELSVQLNDHNGGKNIGSVDSVGKYIRLKVPQISYKSHPFSIFSLPSHPESIKILFRPCGQFTYHLSKICEGLATSPDLTPSDIEHDHAELNLKAVPKMLVNGIGSSCNQLEHTMKHETIVIFAGGVGIVSYISLILLLQTSTISKSIDGFGDEVCGVGANKGSRTKEVHIHWMSRDEGLINHIMRTYFKNTQNEKLLESSVSINFVIHHTNSQEDSSVLDGLGNYFTSKPHNHLESHASPSSAYDGNKSSITKNIFPAATQAIIAFGGLRFIDYCYDNLQEKHSSFETRSIAVIGVAILAVLASAISLASIQICDMIFSRVSYFRLENDGNEIECAEVSNKVPHYVESLDDRHLHSVLDDLGKGPNITSTSMKISHSIGRPNLQAVLSGVFDDMEGDNVGIFLCGPTSLTESVRQAVKECRKKNDEKTYWEYIYQELFEL